MRPLPDEHLSRLGPLLQARSDVHRVARDHQLPACRRLPPRHDLARVDADAQADLDAVASEDVACEPREAVADRESGAHRALGVVVVGDRHAEDGKHRIADELLTEPAEPLDLGVDEGEELALQDAKLLRVDPLGERRRAGDVGEEDGDHAPLVPVVDGDAAARGSRRQRRAAARAERRTG